MCHVAISLRLRPDQRALIARAAELLGKRRTDFILEAAWQKAQSVVLGRAYSHLNGDKLRRFNELLDAPPDPNPGSND
ncbi:MAG: DUF1778 domain-containing protein [Proteobacteria bacterium]|nr:DUF1778 domain-containing protein [Pseudomonadota bacterium]